MVISPLLSVAYLSTTSLSLRITEPGIGIARGVRRGRSSPILSRQDQENIYLKKRQFFNLKSQFTIGTLKINVKVLKSMKDCFSF